uniref:Leucine-rich repeat-containing N-terminal plant-type domain-containing protein n=1 Tax=Nelumbo nucifera TaxID=4432 RepID=A0A822YYL2_NELNU|nr:TPA_asm: hypothetical protein HUJ06_007010 [Nelumbo nucifera]
MGEQESLSSRVHELEHRLAETSLEVREVKDDARELRRLLEAFLSNKERSSEGTATTNGRRFPFLETVKPRSCNHSDNKVGCMEMERAALLDFKENLTDRRGHPSSWVGNDCCSWRGIRCNNRTGRVVQLDLGDPCQDGSWGLSSLVELKLGHCQLHSTLLSPPFVNLTSLLDLHLSGNSLNISILPFFLNVSSLVNLDFGYNRPNDPNLSINLNLNLNIIDQSMPPKARKLFANCRV